MEYIIKKWEQIITTLIMDGYLIFLYFYLSWKKIYNINEDLKSSRLEFLVFTYVFIIFVYFVLVIRELLIKKRINIKELTVIYSPPIISKYIKLALLILINITYLILLLNGVTNIILVAIIAISIFLFPTPMYSSIFEGKDYIICLGNKYYFKNINEVKEGFLFRLRVDVNYKERTIQCFSKKKYLILVERFKSLVK